MNGVCGLSCLFSCARFLADPYNNTGHLWMGLLYPALGFGFDVFDGKVARWSGSASMLGQEMDSLADLVSSFGAVGWVKRVEEVWGRAVGVVCRAVGVERDTGGAGRRGGKEGGGARREESVQEGASVLAAATREHSSPANKLSNELAGRGEALNEQHSSSAFRQELELRRRRPSSSPVPFLS